jgi:hypothetical protein
MKKKIKEDRTVSKKAVRDVKRPTRQWNKINVNHNNQKKKSTGHQFKITL